MNGIELRMVKQYFTAKEYAVYKKLELHEVRRLIAIGKVEIDFPNCHEKVVEFVPTLRLPTYGVAHALVQEMSTNIKTRQVFRGMINHTPTGLCLVG